MGSYGKILEVYLKYFPVEQIRLVFTEETSVQPEKVRHDLYGFIAADAGFTPHSFHHIYHRGGQQKYPGLWPVRRFLSMLEKSMPSRYRGRTFLFDQWSTKPNQGADLLIELRNQLADYYTADVAHLEQFFQVQVPWLESLNPTPCDIRAASSSFTTLWKNSPSKPITCMPSGTNKSRTIVSKGSSKTLARWLGYQ